MQNRRFIFSKLYFPGLISLVGLPLLLISHLFYSGKLVRKSAMEVVWIDNVIIENSEHDYPEQHIKQVLFNRKYTDINLTGDTKKDLFKISLLKKLIAYLSHTKNINLIYRVNFKQHMHYESMVNVLDVCKSDLNREVISVPYKDHVYIFYPRPATYSKGKLPSRMPCGGIRSLPMPPQYPEVSWTDQLIIFTKDVWTIWPALLFLVAMTISGIYNRNKFAL